jgi:hypothetical protein
MYGAHVSSPNATRKDALIDVRPLSHPLQKFCYACLGGVSEHSPG